jgi:two-component system sensor histidine kinase CpxA
MFLKLELLSKFRGQSRGIAPRLFTYLAAVLLLILLIESLAEMALARAILYIPGQIQEEMLELAYQAEVLIEEGDLDEISDWERGQKYYLFILDERNHVLSDRDIHPHFVFKLAYQRDLHERMESQVRKPIIVLPLKTGHFLAIQLPSEVHPARYFSLYSAIMKVCIAIIILMLFSILLARYLQLPLNQLKEASHRLAAGDFNVRVSEQVGESVSEFSSLAKDFDHMAKRIESLSNKQERLIRDVSHELRTPLARHNLALHLLRKRVPAESQLLLDRLERESDEMNNLVGEILEFSRLGSACCTTNLVPIELNAFCEQFSLAHKALLSKEQNLSCAFASEPVWVKADQRLLARVVNNLIVNASKYAGPFATIELSIVKANVADDSSQNNFVTLLISDNGQGVAEQYLKDMFTPFTRIEDARDKQSGGYGLGLAIVKESMLAMQGKASAKNGLLGGLIVTLSLVQIQAEQADQANRNK